MGTITASVDMDEQMKADLAALAEVTGRPVNDLLTEAIAQYLHRETWQVLRLQQALASVEAGRVTPQDEVVADFVRKELFTQEEYDAELYQARAEMEGVAE